MKHTVEALDTYEKNKIRDSFLQRIPKKGERFEVDDKRLKILLGDNNRSLVFVKEIKEIQKVKKESDKNDNIEDL